MRLWNDRPSDLDVRIEIIPLIDVIFCILTFFILGAVGLSRQQAINLDLPKASSGTPQMREMLVVSLDDFGRVYVEKQAVTRNQLTDNIKNYYQNNPNGVMVLHASRNASYSEVIQVLDLLRQVGGDRVALATLPGESTPNGNNWNYPTNPSLPSGTSLPNPYNTPTSPNLPGLTPLPSPNSSTGGVPLAPSPDAPSRSIP
jgi:biopolymer transport protein ExbD